MKRWSSRRVFALLLGVFLALGMSLSAVQAGDMTVKMTLASHMGDSGQGGCDGCGGGDDGNMKTANCMPICTASSTALPPTEVAAFATSADDPPIPGIRLSHGRASSPDPYPPRSTDPV